jgi:hypothetical protein
MDQAELDKIVALAQQASENVTDEALKSETYKIVLTELIRKNVSSDTASANAASAQPAGGSTRPAAKAGSPAAKVAAWVGIDEDALSEIFEFGDSSVAVHLPHTVLPKKAADAQRLLAHLKLSVDKIGYDIDEVASKELISMFDDHGCKDANLAKNLKADEYIISKGGKGTMKSYKLRYTGMSASLGEIQNVLGAGV